MKNSKLTLRKILSIALATLLLFSLFCVTGCTESADETGNTGISSGIPLRDKTSVSSDKTSDSSTKTTSSSKPSVSIPEEDDAEFSVWIPTNGGTKYHSKSTCSNMKNPEKVPLSTAIEEGFEACKRCH